jgi:pilus assembly protein Flp/PilA
MMGDCIERLFTSLVSRLSDEHGQTLVEYAVLVAFIAVVVLAGVQLLGTNLLSFFSSFANAL